MRRAASWDGADGAGGIAGYDGRRGDIFCDHGSRSYHGPVSDSDTGQYHCIAAYPHAAAYGDRTRPLHVKVAAPGVERMTGGIYTYIRADKGMIADCNSGLVEHSKVKIDYHVTADMDIAPVVAAERLVDNDILTAAAQQAAQYPALLVKAVGTEVVELPQGTTRIDKTGMELRHESVINLSVEHLLPLGLEMGHNLI